MTAAADPGQQLTEDAEFRRFAETLARSLSRPHLAEASPAATLAELGLDSLAMLELLVALDNLGALREDGLRAPDPAWLTAGLGQVPLGELYRHFVVPGGPAEMEIP
jgi:hypothetical protein